QTYVKRPSPIVTVQVVSCSSPMGVDISTPGPFRWKLCSSERSLTAMSYVPGASWVTAFPLASRSEMTNASFVPTTATSFGLSACATADGSTSAASSVTRAIRVVMSGLYGSFRGSDFPEGQAGRDQDHAEQDDEPKPLAGERQRGRVAGLLRRRQDALGAPRRARRRGHLAVGPALGRLRSRIGVRWLLLRRGGLGR